LGKTSLLAQQATFNCPAFPSRCAHAVKIAAVQDRRRGGCCAALFRLQLHGRFASEIAIMSAFADTRAAAAE
jgi:hypothetical protein